ncbi:tryptophan 7-halogenase [Microbulbifer agarilyticus]|uniref:tryptophan halogenase family protein n=1 Tax=Microbulbifer agarilyticus TaxID=260552 RepID=UPI001C96776D|nr:tryptophan halogenase family protein [Microbulbifer agarilyticus]MBY6192023.1 tryptophan 7-halogenase [Microbulbifer agarilyticus]
MIEQTKDLVKEVVIVGGGSAGWLTAGVLAAEYLVGNHELNITLVESPDVPTVGVGEGTWPTMRATLKRMGISEYDFIRECDASFKQGSRFIGWRHDSASGRKDEYFHPFTAPAGFDRFDPSQQWQKIRDKISFADAFCPQAEISRHDLAPKLSSTPEYSFALNYGYHLDAGKFAEFLRRHCTEKLGVTHRQDRIVAVESDSNDYVSALKLESGARIHGDLFIDCSGSASLLLGKYYGIELMEQRSILFNDSALAVQVPYLDPESPIASCTHSTAQGAGWIWDIGLPTRRGVGYTYSSAHADEAQAEHALRQYIAPALNGQSVASLEIRKIRFNPGFRRKFWHKNCVAVGMAAGFIEPLEASALVLVEQSAKFLAEQLPPTRSVMKVVENQFNNKMHHHWLRIIDFLKLHYVLSERNETTYWCDHRASSSVPETLQQTLATWKCRSPWRDCVGYADELFPAASYQYILYGMGFESCSLPWGLRRPTEPDAKKTFFENQNNRERLLRTLPSNRQLINKIRDVAVNAAL